MAKVSFEDVSVRLGGVTILESVSAVIPPGSATAIIGPNGAGKTTLLLAMLGLAPYSGQINIAESSRVGYVPQNLDFDRTAPIRVLDMMAMGCQRRPLWLGIKQSVRQRAMEKLSAVGADHLYRQRMGSLSGGELQRVLLAMAIQDDPDILVLDEPATGVDVGGEHMMCELLEDLRRTRGFTQVMVTHDLSLVAAHATYVICLNRRVIGAGTAKDVLTSDVLAATFGIHQGLIDLAVKRTSDGQLLPDGGSGHA